MGRLISAAETLAHVDGQWHGFGKQVAPNATVDEIALAAGIGWNVVKEQIYTRRADGSEREVSNKRALVREPVGKSFDIVGRDWTPVQNRDLLEWAVIAPGASEQVVDNVLGLPAEPLHRRAADYSVPRVHRRGTPRSRRRRRDRD